MPDHAGSTRREPVAGDAQPLPAGLDLLWGRRQPGRRGPKPVLSVDAIVAAATAVADAEGLDAVTMARVASELGFTTMSLYRYVDNKNELLQLMWNASAQGAEDLVLVGEGWRAKLTMWATAQRRMLDRHPWINQLPMAAPPMGPNSAAFLERALEALDDTGLADQDKLGVVGLLSSYTLSETRMAHDAAQAARDEAASPSPSFTAVLRSVLDEQTYPRLHRIAWSTKTPNKPDLDERDQYLFGLECILDGVQAMIERTRPPRRHRPR